MIDVVGFLERIPATLVLLITGTIVLFASFFASDAYTAAVLHGVILGFFAGAVGIVGMEAGR